MKIKNIIDRREIKEILHFTTNLGLLGVLDSGKIKSRHRIKDDQRLEFILKLNTPLVRDGKWIDYVNFSISRINSNLFGISSNKWHSDMWWVILSFDPIILTHPKTTFVTTNNIYPAAQRGQGPASLEPLFANVVLGRYSTQICRTPETHSSVPTCEQAEVLYPGELSTEFLQTIYVSTEEHYDEVHAIISAIGHRTVDVICAPEKFNK